MSKIIDQASEYVSTLLEEQLQDKMHFHDLKHTRQTVEAAVEIAENSKISHSDKEMLIIAAWFHDTGYTKTYKDHEEESITIAESFLTQHEYPAAKIAIIKNIIAKTKMGATPDTELEKIMRDADMSHLAKKSGLKRGQMLRQELADCCKKEYSDDEWLELDKQFYMALEYHTDYAKKNWQPKLEKNIDKIDQKIENGKSDTKQANRTEEMEKIKKPTVLSEKDLKKLQKIKATERGVETVFRTTSRNHLRLSSMADTKANTLISISALIISIILSFLVENLDVQPFLTLPTSILLVVCVITIIFSTLSTRPKVTKLGLTREDIKQRKGNLLFFGNFYQMALDDYQWGMQELMDDRDYLYSTLTRDIYFLGIVLAKKYKFLSIAYNVFMYGIILSVLAFLIAINLSS